SERRADEQARPASLRLLGDGVRDAARRLFYLYAKERLHRARDRLRRGASATERGANYAESSHCAYLVRSLRLALRRLHRRSVLHADADGERRGDRAAEEPPRVRAHDGPAHRRRPVADARALSRPSGSDAQGPGYLPPAARALADQFGLLPSRGADVAVRRRD